MNSKTIANEYTHLFYIKLKRKLTTDWYLSKIGELPLRKLHLPKELLKKELAVNQIGFFKKHVWYHFMTSNINGWILAGNVRNNYRRLEVPIVSQNNRNNFIDSVYMLLKYENNSISYQNVIKYFDKEIKIFTPNVLANLVLNQTGTFKNISNKSVRRIRSQLLRCRPVMLWGGKKSLAKINSIVVTGFNHHLFFYNDPVDGHLKTISKSNLIKYWKASNYLAISY